MSQRSNNVLDHVINNVKQGAKLSVDFIVPSRDGGLTSVSGSLMGVDLECNVLILNCEFMGRSYTKLIPGDKIAAIDIY